MNFMNRRTLLATTLAASIDLLASRAYSEDAPKKTDKKPKARHKKGRGKGDEAGQPGPGAIAIVGAELWRGEAPPLPNSVIIIDRGKLFYVGTDRSLIGSARIVNANGKVVTAGLVDPLTAIGLTEVSLEKSSRDDQHDSDDPIRAAFRAADGYNPESSLIAITRREGISSVGVVPNGGLVTGQSAWADLVGKTPQAALVNDSLALHVRLHDGSKGDFGESRGSAMLRLRELFDDTRAYQQNRGRYNRRELRKLGASRLDYETVSRALAGKLRVVFHVDRASDIVNVLDLARRYQLRAVLASAAEGWKVAPMIAAARVPVIVYPLDHGPRSFAALGAREDNAKWLHRAGVTIALSTGESHNARKLPQEAGNAVRAGLSKQVALDAITSAPARIFGMDDRYGTPTVGRVANLAVWTGDPFELSSHAESLYIRGRSVSMLSRQTALYERYAD